MDDPNSNNIINFKILFPGQYYVDAFSESSSPFSDIERSLNTIYICCEQSIDALSKFSSTLCKGISVLSLKNESNGTYKANIVNSLHEVFVPITLLIGRIMINLHSIKDDAMTVSLITQFLLELINEYVLAPCQGNDLFHSAECETNRNSIESIKSDYQPVLVNILDDPLKAKVYYESYRIMRAFIPVNIFRLTIENIVSQGLPKPIAERIWKNKILWLLCMHPKDIAKVHIGDLRGKYLSHGLDLVEMRAVWYVLPDWPGRTEKAQWRRNFKDKLDSLEAAELSGSLSNQSRRNPVYENYENLNLYDPNEPLQLRFIEGSDAYTNSHTKLPIQNNKAITELAIPTALPFDQLKSPSRTVYAAADSTERPYSSRNNRKNIISAFSPMNSPKKPINISAVSRSINNSATNSPKRPDKLSPRSRSNSSPLSSPSPRNYVPKTQQQRILLELMNPSVKKVISTLEEDDHHGDKAAHKTPHSNNHENITPLSATQTPRSQSSQFNAIQAKLKLLRESTKMSSIQRRIIPINPLNITGVGRNLNSSYISNFLSDNESSMQSYTPNIEHSHQKLIEGKVPFTSTSSSLFKANDTNGNSSSATTDQNSSNVAFNDNNNNNQVNKSVIKPPLLVSDFLEESPLRHNLDAVPIQTPTVASSDSKDNTWRSVATHNHESVSPLTPFFERLSTIASGQCTTITTLDGDEGKKEKYRDQQNQYIESIKKVLSSSHALSCDLMSEISTNENHSLVERKMMTMKELDLINEFSFFENDQLSQTEHDDFSLTSDLKTNTGDSVPSYNIIDRQIPTRISSEKLTKGSENQEELMMKSTDTNTSQKANIEGEPVSDDRDATVDSINALVDSFVANSNTPQQTPDRSNVDNKINSKITFGSQSNSEAVSTMNLQVPASSVNDALPPRSPSSPSKRHRLPGSGSPTRRQASPLKNKPSSSRTPASSHHYAPYTGAGPMSSSAANKNNILFSPAFAGGIASTSKLSDSSNESGFSNFSNISNMSPSQIIQNVPSQNSRVAYRVIIQSAHNLTQTGRKNSPYPSAYCTIYLVDAKGRSCVGFSTDCQTPVEKNNDNPVWNKQFVLRLTESYSGRPPAGVMLEVKDSSSGLFTHKHIGQVVIPSNCFLTGTEAQFCLPLEPVGGNNLKSNQDSIGEIRVITELVAVGSTRMYELMNQTSPTQRQTEVSMLDNSFNSTVVSLDTSMVSKGRTQHTSPNLKLKRTQSEEDMIIDSEIDNYRIPSVMSPISKNGKGQSIRVGDLHKSPTATQSHGSSPNHSQIDSLSEGSRGSPHRLRVTPPLRTNSSRPRRSKPKSYQNKIKHNTAMNKDLSTKNIHDGEDISIASTDPSALSAPDDQLTEFSEDQTDDNSYEDQVHIKELFQIYLPKEIPVGQSIFYNIDKIKAKVENDEVYYVTDDVDQLLIDYCAIVDQIPEPLEVIMLLVDYFHADVNNKNVEDFMTPLHYFFNKPLLGRFIILRGGDLLAENIWGESPLQICLDYDYDWIVEAFESTGYELALLQDFDRIDRCKQYIKMLIKNGKYLTKLKQLQHKGDINITPEFAKEIQEEMCNEQIYKTMEINNLETYEFLETLANM